MLHRILNSIEEVEFVEWANDNYQANQTIDRDLWHPVIVQRCDEINSIYYNRRNQEVIDRALSRLFTDVIKRDLKAIEEMLSFVPKQNLLAYIDAESAADHLLRVSNPFPVEGRMKNYKFWNPEHVDKYLELVQQGSIDSRTCTAAELTKAEADGKISTEILLIDDKQADAIVQMFINETVYEDLRYEEIKEDV